VDALALSAVSARTGIPILLVSRDRIPDPTRAVLRSLPGSDVIVAGSTAVVSTGTYSGLGASGRWAGPNRYATAVEIARGARARAWLDGTVVGIAAAVPDALTGATRVGKAGGPLLYSISGILGQPAAAYLASVGPALTQAKIFGSPKVVAAAVELQLGGAPAQPAVSSPIDAPYLGKRATIRALVGVNTSEVRLYRNGMQVASVIPAAYSTVDFGSFDTPTDGVTYRVEAVNPLGGSSSWQKTFKRLAYPSASSSIVIDKSEYRLYLVKNDVLIEHYPVATGRPSMETPVRLWRVGAKYLTDPKSVYGPRKMRLYKWTGQTFVSTGYLIHGTNEPWVIGTKASHGCIRLYNSDVLDLYPQVPIGTLVQTRE
jgi:lipoprotein-anchoring transpeptidase ErfK/SrfK